jgi:hypothetical protein
MSEPKRLKFFLKMTVLLNGDYIIDHLPSGLTDDFKCLKRFSLRSCLGWFLEVEPETFFSSF